jgi:hypothetical protein
MGGLQQASQHINRPVNEPSQAELWQTRPDSFRK